ncbi:hypothetical protein BLNAU_21183 [Blattamonas nauphoetae]|uniref:Uncharacterized protein n=1 Tax=Blattamonas nauphoetae TaxID=2049346 RepID=A0ABQ9WLJ4_9EUKA|nr:hypothetical protein BLNAU_24751 [Blattamonas nauphoetae]KAK2943880.1 hypothetical protein BLNAU_21183 [Blattamonas nauphoetae]
MSKSHWDQQTSRHHTQPRSLVATSNRSDVPREQSVGEVVHNVRVNVPAGAIEQPADEAAEESMTVTGEQRKARVEGEFRHLARRPEQPMRVPIQCAHPDNPILHRNRARSDIDWGFGEGRGSEGEASGEDEVLVGRVFRSEDDVVDSQDRSVGLPQDSADEKGERSSLAISMVFVQIVCCSRTTRDGSVRVHVVRVVEGHLDQMTSNCSGVHSAAEREKELSVVRGGIAAEHRLMVDKIECRVAFVSIVRIKKNILFNSIGSESVPFAAKS